MSTSLSAIPSWSQHDEGTTVPSFLILLLISNPECKSLEVEFNSMQMKNKDSGYNLTYGTESLPRSLSLQTYFAWKVGNLEHLTKWAIRHF